MNPDMVTWIFPLAIVVASVIGLVVLYRIIRVISDKFTTTQIVDAARGMFVRPQPPRPLLPPGEWTAEQALTVFFGQTTTAAFVLSRLSTETPKSADEVKAEVIAHHSREFGKFPPSEPIDDILRMLGNAQLIVKRGQKYTATVLGRNVNATVSGLY